MISFATLTNRGIVTVAGQGDQLCVDRDYFNACHRPLVAAILFDEDFYLDTYPDVAEALKAGGVGSAHEHYVTRGYYENRLPYAIGVDEDWYLEAYRDVHEAVQDGQFDSGQSHFERAGFAEGRLAFAHFSLRTAGKPRGPAP
jgi:hypothetical protein